MSKKRVYEIAKELKMDNKEVIKELNDMGLQIANHMNAVEDEFVAKLQQKLQAKREHIKQPSAKEKPESDTKSADRNQVQQQGQQRPQGQGQQRPQGTGQRPQGQGQQRPQGTGQRPQWQGQQRPQGTGQRPQGQGQQRPQGTGQRPQGQGQQRPQGTGQRPQGQGQQRSQGTGQRPQGQGQHRPQEHRSPHNDNRGNFTKGDDYDRSHKQQDRRNDSKSSSAHTPDNKQGRGERSDRNVGNNHNYNDKSSGKHNNKQRKNDRIVNENSNRKSGNKKPNKDQSKQQVKPAEPQKPQRDPKITIEETIVVQDLAKKLKVSPAELIKQLFMLGVMATINEEIDFETAALLASEYDVEVEKEAELTEEEIFSQDDVEDDPKDLVPRPCVVTVMGHVDHGKTSLLDAIRETKVTETEAGGITQHIGAYQVTKNDQLITFLDTPGHEAFTAMRARGAQATDIAILVVAADDGVMPQTIEAINHAKAAEVPIIVAINKIDKPGANPDKVKQELTEYGLIAEDWGGTTIMVPCSAVKKEGIEDILEMILLVAEIEDFKANPNRLAQGTVIEAKLDKGRGPVATILVQNGTLNVGDAIIAGKTFGRVRAMIDAKGKRCKKAPPSTPVEVQGLNEVPEAGDMFRAVSDERKARNIVDKLISKKKEAIAKTKVKVNLEDLFKNIQEGQIKELNIIVKADVHGSVEAIKQSLARLNTGEVRVNPIHGGVGAITETDVMLASASNAIIIGFNVRPDANASKAAEAEQVDIRLYRVIYDAIEDVKQAMSGLLDPDYKDVVIGHVEVRKIYKVSKVGTIAGCYVQDGKVTRESNIHVIRDSIVIHQGKIDTLKRFKDDAKEVVQGYECGITIENYNDIKEGDIIEAFIVEEIKRKLD